MSETCPLCDSPLEGRDTMFQRIGHELVEVHGRCETSRTPSQDRSGYKGHRALPDSRHRLIPR